jgi:hypothetical protein
VTGRAADGPDASNRAGRARTARPAADARGPARVGTVRGRVTGAQWEQTVLDLAARLGWMRAHFRPARTATGGWTTPVAGDGAGFPDLVLVRRGRVLFVELKAGSGRVTREQRRWLDELAATPAEVHVWHPADWDAIVDTLR